MRLLVTPRLYNGMLISAMICQQMGYVMSAIGISKVWYWFNALTMVIFALALFNVTRGHFNIHRSRWSWAVSMYVVVLTVSQFVDELIGDPSKIQWNEYLVGSTILAHTIYTAYAIHRSKLDT